MQIEKLHNIVDIQTGFKHTLFLDNQLNLFGCGSNKNG